MVLWQTIFYEVLQDMLISWPLLLTEPYTYPPNRSDPVKRKNRKASNVKRRSSSASPKNALAKLTGKKVVTGSESDPDKGRSKPRHRKSLTGRGKWIRDEDRDQHNTDISGLDSNSSGSTIYVLRFDNYGVRVKLLFFNIVLRAKFLESNFCLLSRLFGVNFYPSGNFLDQSVNNPL